MCCHSGTGRCSSTTTVVSPRTVWIQPPNSSALLTVPERAPRRLPLATCRITSSHPAHPVGQEVHLVHDDMRKTLQRGHTRMEHHAQHLGCLVHDVRVSVDRLVA